MTECSTVLDQNITEILYRMTCILDSTLLSHITVRVKCLHNITGFADEFVNICLNLLLLQTVTCKITLCHPTSWMWSSRHQPSLKKKKKKKTASALFIEGFLSQSRVLSIQTCNRPQCQYYPPDRGVTNVLVLLKPLSTHRSLSHWAVGDSVPTVWQSY